MPSNLKIFFTLAILLISQFAYASGGYDNGTPAGKGNLDIDITLNPGDRIRNGQSYVVWGYGLTDKLDFHGYVSHEASGTNQIYYGLMYNFFSNSRFDLSTAFGLRHRKGIVDAIFPQFLYTIKLKKGFDIIGSSVLVYNTKQKFTVGTTLDVALRIPVPKSLTPSFAKDVKVAVGAFRGATTTKWYPTYSIDFRF
ncbi:MAG: hypothetical protein GXP13_05110 [Gammaproteobacteria bacterium]|nr:hypothetical protein [Gammaproteobacteria bacterium]